MHIIRSMAPSKSQVACLSSIFLFICLPNSLPAIPNIIMAININTSKDGIVSKQTVFKVLVTCENNTMYRLFWVAVFVFIEKK